MLLKLHRVGSLRHSLAKSYVLLGELDCGNVTGSLQRFAEGSEVFSRSGLGLGFDKRRPRQVQIVTGLVDIHTHEARSRLARQLADAVGALAEHASSLGATLVPSAMRDGPQTDWADCVAADVHVIEVEDDLERTQLCNALREELPLLVALTGRTAVDGWTVAKAGSKRLTVETGLVAARPFPFFSEQHLPRMRSYYRHRMGVPRLEQLEICPVAEDLQGQNCRPATVTCRFIAGQMLVSSAIACLVLLEAMALRLRRRLRAEPFGGAWPQRYTDERELARQRAEAIALGVGMQLRGAARNDGAGEEHARERRSAAEDVLALVTFLEEELRILEVTVEEIAPLVVGATLRVKGMPACLAENDLLRGWAREQAGSPAASVTARAAALLREPEELMIDQVTAANKACLAAATNEALGFWSERLQPRVPDWDAIRMRTANLRESDAGAMPPPAAEKVAPPQLLAAGPSGALLRSLRSLGPDDASRQVERLIAGAKRQNWSEWTDRLSGDDRQQLWQLLGLTGTPVSAEDGGYWNGGWTQSARAHIEQRGWAAQEVEIKAPAADEVDAMVRRFFEQTPGDLLAVCLRYELVKASHVRVRITVICARSARPTWQ